MTAERGIKILLVIALVAAVAWLLLHVVPMPHPFGVLLIGAAVIIGILILLREVGGAS
jgi:hypothetical protein